MLCTGSMHSAVLGLCFLLFSGTLCVSKRILKIQLDDKEATSLSSTDHALGRATGSGKHAIHQHKAVDSIATELATDLHRAVDSVATELAADLHRTVVTSQHIAAPEPGQKQNVLIYAAVAIIVVIFAALTFLIHSMRKGEDVPEIDSRSGRENSRPQVTFSNSVNDRYAVEHEGAGIAPIAATLSLSAQRRAEAEAKWKPKIDTAPTLSTGSSQKTTSDRTASPESVQRGRRKGGTAKELAEEAAEAKRFAEEKEREASAAKADAKVAEQKADEADAKAKNTVSKLNCEWMYADAGQNSLGNAMARLDPMRWSGGLTLENCRRQLEELKKKGEKRPIMLRVPAGFSGKRETLAGPKEALAYLSTVCPLRNEANQAAEAAHVVAGAAVARDKKAKRDAQKAQEKEQEASARAKAAA